MAAAQVSFPAFLNCTVFSTYVIGSFIQLEHGRRRGGVKAPLDFENFRKKVVFLISGGKKQLSPLLAPPWKNFGKKS